MRRRNEFLLFHEADQCPRVEFLTGAAGTVNLALDQTLAPSAPPRPGPAPAGPAVPAAPAAPRR
jgi:hypothetical protein